jgi:biopolymer transport protein ExbD
VSFTQREARRIIRKAVGRVPEGEEIRHLNIMPMMDMMTILLVAFIAQAATSSTELNARTVSLPPALSDDELPPDVTTLIITKNGVTVAGGKEAKPIVSISNGQVDPAEKEGGALGHKIPRLTNYLSAIHAEHEANARKKPDYDPAKHDSSELMIIADRTTPYALLVDVMFSAKQKEAGYKHFRLIVQKSFPAQPATK